MIHKINTSELREKISLLKVRDRVLLSGYIYTARDAAHSKFIEMLKNKQPLSINLNGAVIYYTGPTGTPKGLAIGSCGPTTSCRMDKFTPALLDMGLICMIGKGDRNEEVKRAIVKNKAVYLCAVGGAGALACKCIKSSAVVAFPELGCESVKRLYAEDFPLIVAIDADGNDIFNKTKSSDT